MNTFHLAACTIHIASDLIVTTMPDGAEVHGAPHDTDDYRATARRLGYGDDVARLNIEHETAHSLLAHVMGLPASPTFQRLAAGQHTPTVLTGIEEDAVFALQRFCNAVGVDLVARARVLGGRAGR